MKDQSNKKERKYVSRLKKWAIIFAIFIVVSVAIIFIAPYMIKPEQAKSLSKGITEWWGISTIIQYLIYVLIAFKLLPYMINKRLDQFRQEEVEYGILFDNGEITESTMIYQVKIIHRKIERILWLSTLKARIMVVVGLIIFDIVAGQLPFFLMKGGF